MFKVSIILTALALTLNLSGCHSAAHIIPPKSHAVVTNHSDANLSKDRLGNPITKAYGVKVISDIAYATDERQRLDIYTPNDNQRHPVLIFVYGGSWQTGKRQTYAFVGRQFAKAGYTTVIVDYRLAPQHVFPDYVLDTAHAMRWVYQNIAQYGGNPDQLFAMGHSAGAFNVVSAVDDQRFWTQTGIPDKALRGVIGLAGPYDYDFRMGKTQVAFPKNTEYQHVMPVYHIRQGVPPHLLVTGEKDTIVHPYNADSLQHALTKAGGQVERLQVPASHAGIVVGLSKPLQPFYPTFGKVNDFMQRRLAAKS